MTKVLELNGIEEGELILAGLEDDGSLLFRGEWDEIFLSALEVKALLKFLKQNLEIKLENV